jgi:DnaJ-class molecular chaperone
MDTPNYYKILNLPQGASNEQVWLQFQRMSREFGEGEFYDFKKFFLTEEAYLVLSHPKTRREYDSWLKNSSLAQEKNKRTALVAFWTGFFSSQLVTALLMFNQLNKTHVAIGLGTVLVLFLLFSYWVNNSNMPSLS